jgi:hypothetical protein
MLAPTGPGDVLVLSANTTTAGVHVVPGQKLGTTILTSGADYNLAFGGICR